MKARRLALRALAIVMCASIIAPASAVAAPEMLTPTTANFGGQELAVNGYLHESCVFGRRRARPQALR